MRWRCLAALLLSLAWPVGAAESQELKVGSKAFTESVVLGEMIAHLAQDAGALVLHHRQLGGTRVLWDALLLGEIDVYPEYTGTIANEILADEGLGLSVFPPRATPSRPAPEPSRHIGDDYRE